MKRRVTRWIRLAVVLYISRMSPQAPLPSPAPALHGHPHSLFPRVLGRAWFGTMKGKRGQPGEEDLVEQPAGPPPTSCSSASSSVPHPMRSRSRCEPGSPTRMTRFSRALACSRRADSKKMLAEDVTDLSEISLHTPALPSLRPWAGIAQVWTASPSPRKQEPVPSSKSSLLVL